MSEAVEPAVPDKEVLLEVFHHPLNLFFGNDRNGERDALLYGLIGIYRLNETAPESCPRNIISRAYNQNSSQTVLTNSCHGTHRSPINNRQYAAPLTLTLNDRVLSFYESDKQPMLRILTDMGIEYCGKVESHNYQLYLAINDIDHTKRYLQARPQDELAGVLSCDVPQKSV